MGMEVQMNSIVMTTYNGMPFVKEQVDSIRRQLLPDDEFIISDNGSTDGTAEWVEQHYPTVMVLHSKENHVYVNYLKNNFLYS